MGTKKNAPSSVDSLFGSKTRVKLLHLFFNNTETSYYVREITRLIGEQINSVRRELANLVQVGVITSDSAENKLFYKIDDSYEHYDAFRAIFTDTPIARKANTHQQKQIDGVSQLANVSIEDRVRPLVDYECIKLAIVGGALVAGSSSPVDILLVVSDAEANKGLVARIIKSIEKVNGKEVAYTAMEYDEFYYRISVRDKFVASILDGSSKVVVDSDNIVSKES